MASSSHILNQARNIGLLTLSSSALGFARELAIAHKFGATTSTDAYLVALSVPTTLYGLLFGSGLNLAVIPRLAHIFNDDPGGGRKTFAQFLSVAVVIGALISLLILFLPASLIKIFAPGMAPSTLTQQFTRTLSPVFFLFVGSYSLGSFQCAQNRTSAWPLVGLTQNAIIVIGISLMSGLLGFRSLILGTVAGALFALLVQLVLARRAQFCEPWSLPLYGGQAMGILGALLPFALVLGVGGDSGTSQADIFLIRFFASRLDPGSVTLLALGNKLMGLPVLLIGSAIGLALLPTATIHLGRNDLRSATEHLVQAFGCACLLICPIALFYWNLSSEIVSAVFRHGAITPLQLLELGRILRAYSGATVGLTLVYVLSSFMGVLRQTRVLIGTGILAIILNAWLMQHLVVRYGAIGIAASVSIGSASYCAVLLLLLTRQLGWGVLLRLLRSGFLVGVGGFGMQMAIVAMRGLHVCTSVPWLGRAAIPTVMGVTLYAVWVLLHRKTIALTQI